MERDTAPTADAAVSLEGLGAAVSCATARNIVVQGPARRPQAGRARQRGILGHFGAFCGALALGRAVGRDFITRIMHGGWVQAKHGQSPPRRGPYGGMPSQLQEHIGDRLQLIAALEQQRQQQRQQQPAAGTNVELAGTAHHLISTRNLIRRAHGHSYLDENPELISDTASTIRAVLRIPILDWPRPVQSSDGRETQSPHYGRPHENNIAGYRGLIQESPSSTSNSFPRI